MKYKFDWRMERLIPWGLRKQILKYRLTRIFGGPFKRAYAAAHLDAAISSGISERCYGRDVANYVWARVLKRGDLIDDD